MRRLTLLALLAIPAICLGQGSPAGYAQDSSASPAGSAAATDAVKMTPEQQRQQFRCEQTREQIRQQLGSKVKDPSAEANLKSLRESERISCVPPLVPPPPTAAATPARYPAQAMRQHHQGVAIVRVELAADGSVASDSIYQSSGFLDLDRSAMEAVRGWHFDTQLGLSLRVPVRFSLDR
jgi:TonB family protein